MMTLETRQFNFISILTGVVVTTFVGVASASYLMGIITWTQYSGSVVPLATGLIGFWIRGNNSGGTP